MNRLIYAVLIICFLSFPNYARAQTGSDPDRPDVSKWNLLSKSNISVRISDKVMYYLGFDMTYQNPDNLNEYVRQVRVLIPFVVVKSRSNLDKNFIDTMTSYVTDGAERELLKMYVDKSDSILYVRWKEKKDLKRKTIELDGVNQVWLWNSSGRWVYSQNTVVRRGTSSETFKELGNNLIIVGFKYSLSRLDYNAREIPYGYVVVAIKASKGVK